MSDQPMGIEDGINVGFLKSKSGKTPSFEQDPPGLTGLSGMNFRPEMAGMAGVGPAESNPKGPDLPGYMMPSQEMGELAENVPVQVRLKAIAHGVANLERYADGGDPERAYPYEVKAYRAEAVKMPWDPQNEALGLISAVKAIADLDATWVASKGKLATMVDERSTYPVMPDQGAYYESLPGIDVGCRAYMRAGEIIRNVTTDNGVKLENLQATTLYVEAQLEGESASALRRAVTNEILLRQAERDGNLLIKLESKEGIEEVPGRIGHLLDKVFRWDRGDVQNIDDLGLISKGDGRGDGEENRVWLKLDERTLRIDRELEELVQKYVRPDVLDGLRVNAALAEMRARKLMHIWGEFASYDPCLRISAQEMSEAMHLGYWMRDRYGKKTAGPLATNGMLYGREKTKTVPSVEPIINTGFYLKGDVLGPFTLFARDDSGRSLRQLILFGEKINWGRFEAQKMKTWATLTRVMKGLPEDSGFIDSKFVKPKGAVGDLTTEAWLEGVGNNIYLLLALSPIVSTMKDLQDRHTRSMKTENRSAQESSRYKLGEDGRIWNVETKEFLDKEMVVWRKGELPKPETLAGYDQIVHSIRALVVITLLKSQTTVDFQPKNDLDMPTLLKKIDFLIGDSSRSKVNINAAFINKEKLKTRKGIESEFNNLWKMGKITWN